MPRRVLLQSGDTSVDLVEVPAPSELDLQQVVTAHPQLIPADDLGLDGELLVVGRETTLASGAIDLLCLARSGDLVLIEFKTGPKNPDFRAALAQVIDYGSDLWGMSVTDFDQGVVQRYLSGRYVDAAFAKARSLQEAVALTNWGLGDEDCDLLRTRLSDVLRNGDFRFVVAAQRFTSSMVASLDYLNATTRYGRYYLVQVLRLEGNNTSGYSAYSAQLVAAPSETGNGGLSGPASRASEADFLAGISDENYREAMERLFSSAEALGLVTFWGSKGASLRIKTRDRTEPLSVAWAFLQGGQWYGARHLTLGVDRQSLASTPSVRGQVDAFVEAIKGIPGHKPVASTLDGYTFEPNAVPGAISRIIVALEDLVRAVSAAPEATDEQ